MALVTFWTDDAHLVIGFWRATGTLMSSVYKKQNFNRWCFLEENGLDRSSANERIYPERPLSPYRIE